MSVCDPSIKDWGCGGPGLIPSGLVSHAGRREWGSPSAENVILRPFFDHVVILSYYPVVLLI